MIFGFSSESEAWVTPDMERNVSEILPHSTPFLNDRSESLDIPSAIDRGIKMKYFFFVIFEYFETWIKLLMLNHI